MKTLKLIIVTIAFSSPFIKGEELQVKHPSYGLGMHKIYDANAGGVQLISKIIKNECEYQFEMGEDNIPRLYRMPELDETQKELIATFNKYLFLGGVPGSSVWIVDVSVLGTEIAFLVTSAVGYQYFKVTNQNIDVPQGWYLCERDGINSTNWKVVRCQLNVSYYGNPFMDWCHFQEINSVKLLNMNTIEIDRKGAAQPANLIVTQDAIQENGISIDNAKIFNPILMSEQELIDEFSQEISPTLDDVRLMVRFYKGGKDFLLKLLTQFADQNAASQIRARILEAHPE